MESQAWLSPLRESEQRVTPLELFFDLVFVLSFTQVTAVDRRGSDLAGTGRGDADPGRRLVGVGRLRLAHQRDRPRPEPQPPRDVRGDGGDAGRLARPSRRRSATSGCCSAAPTSRCGRCTCSCTCATPAGTATRTTSSAILKLAPGLLLGSALLVVAGALDGGARTSLWIIALLIDWSTPLALRDRRVQHPARPLRRAPRADRDHRPRRVDRRDRRGGGLRAETGEVIAAVLAITAVAALWWAYFDIVAIVAERG